MTAAAIADILGGPKILGRTITRTAELAALVRRGIPARTVKALAAHLDARQSDVSATLGIPQRTLTRRLGRHERLTPAESDRTVRLARVFAAAVDGIGNRDKATAWLRTPNRALGGAKPIDHLDTDPGARDVEDLLGRIAHGVYS